MGYQESFSRKGDPRTAIAIGVESRRYVKRTAQSGHEVMDIAGVARTSDSAAVQYCISNDLI